MHSYALIQQIIRSCIVSCLLVFFMQHVIAQGGFSSQYVDNVDESSTRVYQTQRRTQQIKIDGLVDDTGWNEVAWSGDFTQREPDDGGAPTLPTTFKIVYDDRNIYVAIRCLDPEPDKIVQRMSRRDGFEGDWVEINIDSYHDQRTAFSFTISAAGVKGDEICSQDGQNWDKSWNPIWRAKSHVDAEGWTAEMEIPLSQLRFDDQEEQIWGLQLTRRDFRNDSRSNWQYIPQNSGYWVSGFGELHGIDNIKPKRQIEIQPYVLGRHESYKKVDGHPFRDGSDSDLNVGLDGKIGVTNDLTLDFTINPDFGQVEADPGALNLDGFEVFFTERRPFFVENRNVFDYKISNAKAGGGFNQDNLFYSRRIGAAPKRVIAESDGRFVEQPSQSAIIGAAKFSGKTNKGLSIGVLESLTREEKAIIREGGTEEKAIVEPLTNYAVLRLLQDFDDGNTVIGLIGTSVNRRLNDDDLQFLHKSAYSGGIDFLHQWRDKRWRLAGSLVGSHVAGSEESILRTQRSFGHTFQRPDAEHVSIDSSATSLSGSGANLSLGYFGRKWSFQGGATYRSPEFELNDIGFLRNADEINQYFWAELRWLNPTKMFRESRANFNQKSRWDYSGKSLHQSINFNAYGTLHNFWQLRAGTGIEFNDQSNTWLRGGPTFRKPHGWGVNFAINSDKRKKISQEFSSNGGNSFDGIVGGYGFNTTTNIQATDGLNFSLGFSWRRSFREDQYIRQLNYGDYSDYLMGEIVRRTVNFTLRANYNLTPDLTIQYYGQPYISRGRYSDLKRVGDPVSRDAKKRLIKYTTDQLTYDAALRQYQFDFDENGITDVSIGNPDFDFVQFRSNLVLRWEYVPGSELFLVWSQGSNAYNSDYSGSVWESLSDNLWDDSLVNTFLVKATYRFSL